MLAFKHTSNTKPIMNRSLLIYTVSLLILFVTFTGCATENGNQLNSTWSEVQETGDGTITLHYVPSDGFSYSDEEGNLTGVTIELMRDFVDFVRDEYEVNISIHFNPIDQFSEFYNTVKNGSGGEFGVANVTITEERKNELAFSPPYMTNIATLITHSEIDELTSFDDIPGKFEGLTALAFEGTLHEDRLNKIRENYLPDAAMEFAHSNNEIIEKTSLENRYFAYVDIYNYWRASQGGAELRRHSAGDESSEQFGVIMPLDSDWHNIVEEFFDHEEGYLQSERYRELMETHLGSELAALLLSQ